MRFPADPKLATRPVPIRSAAVQPGRVATKLSEVGLMDALRRWFVEAGFSRRDAIRYCAGATMSALAVAGYGLRSWWLLSVAAAIFIWLMSESVYYAVKIVRLLDKRRRSRRVA